MSTCLRASIAEETLTNQWMRKNVVWMGDTLGLAQWVHVREGMAAEMEATYGLSTMVSPHPCWPGCAVLGIQLVTITLNSGYGTIPGETSHLSVKMLVSLHPSLP